MLYAEVIDGVIDKVTTKPTDTPVPVGTVPNSKIKDGVITPPPPKPATSKPLNPVQFFAMVEILGKETEIIAAINSIENPVKRAGARAKFYRSTRYDRDDDLFTTLGPLVGLTDAEIDAAWAEALKII